MNEGIFRIDPAVLFLQVVAFVILYLVMSRYLFRPLMTIMQERQREIAHSLEAGEQARSELARIEQERERVLAVAREDGRRQVREVVQEGRQEREQILREAREQARQIQERAHSALAMEREEVMLRLRQEMIELSLMAAKRAVATELDEGAHRRAIDDFITQMERQA